MRLALGCAAFTVTLTGCFSDPPSSSASSSDGASSSGAAGTSSSTSSAEASTTTALQTSSESSGFLDGSTSFGTTGGICELEAFEPGTVPADIVVLIDADVGANLLGGLLGQVQSVSGNNVAVLAPQALLAELKLDSDCPAGCEGAGCDEPANRVTVPYTGSAYGALGNFDSFSCMFRDPAPETSGPVGQLWFITQSPEQMPPMELAAIVLDGQEPLRVNVACPNCDDNLFNANALLKAVVEESGGTVSDSNEPATVVEQITAISAQRHSCAWATETLPEFYAFEPPMALDPFFADPVAERSDCPDNPVLSTGSGAYYPDESGVALCPETCKALQTFPASFVDVSACF